MKEQRSNKTYHSRLTRWVDRLLLFDFNSEHITGAKMGLVDYISRQLNQKAKVTNKYNEELAFATITWFRDAIIAFYFNSAPTNSQSQHINTVNNTNSSRATNTHQINLSKLLSALNLRTSKLQTQHKSSFKNYKHGHF